LELLAPAALLLVAGCNAGRYRRPVAIGPTALFFAGCGRRGVAAALKFPPTLFSVAWGNSRGAGPILRPSLVLALRRLRRRGSGLLAPVLKIAFARPRCITAALVSALRRNADRIATLLNIASGCITLSVAAPSLLLAIRSGADSALPARGAAALISWRSALPGCQARGVFTQNTGISRANCSRPFNIASGTYEVRGLTNIVLTQLLAKAVATLSIGAHLDGARNSGGAGENSRSHIIGPDGPADRSREEPGRDTGVDGEALVLDQDRSVDDNRLPEQNRCRIHVHRQQVRSEYLLRLDEHPVTRAFAHLHNDFVGR